MHGNVKTMNNIKDKLEVLMKIDHVDDKVAHPVIGLPPVEPKAQQQRAEAPDFIPHPEKYGGNQECPAVIPYRNSNADYLMNDLIDQWDFRVISFLKIYGFIIRDVSSLIGAF